MEKSLGAPDFVSIRNEWKRELTDTHRHCRSAINSHRSVLGQSIDTVTYLCVCVRSSQPTSRYNNQLLSLQTTFLRRNNCKTTNARVFITFGKSQQLFHGYFDICCVVKNTFYRLGAIVLCSNSGMNNENAIESDLF